MTPVALEPLARTQPFGDDVQGFRVRNAGGWYLTAEGLSQKAGRVKAFYGGLDPANAFTPMGDPRIAPSCTASTCSRVNGSVGTSWLTGISQGS